MSVVRKCGSRGGGGGIGRVGGQVGHGGVINIREHGAGGSGRRMSSIFKERVGNIDVIRLRL